MTTVEKIRQCKTPQEALLVLAEAVDEIVARLEAEPTPDVWSQPLEWGAPAPATEAAAPEDPSSAQQRRIAAIRERLASEHDPDEIRALEAQLRIALEEHVHLEAAAVPGLEPEEGGIITVPPATPERRKAREQWARRVQLEQYVQNAAALGMTEGGREELHHNFGVIGPKGLYVADRLAIMQLPVDERRWLVEDMAVDDEAYAQNMGADILKSEEAISQDQAREMFEGTWKT
jgi:hypothetical protein